ncbi:hypothetical protein LXL04_015220 [Taraxacum kok-saghyz]
MVGQRSSSWLRKLTTKMSNTVESSVLFDEDDDFVNPGPADKTSTPKKHRDQVQHPYRKEKQELNHMLKRKKMVFGHLVAVVGVLSSLPPLV